MSISPIFGYIQNYEWGKCSSSDCLVRRLSKKTVGNHDDKPLAEIWYGTHPNGMTKLLDNNTSLLEHLGHPLPFLFKALSIGKELSIQVHPDKTNAEHLHRIYPQVYKDPNHKPEMAIAISNFTALCGFRSYKEISNYLRIIPELHSLITTSISNEFIHLAEDNSSSSDSLSLSLKKTFHSLMNVSQSDTSHYIAKMIKRFEKIPKKEKMNIENLVIKLASHYPNDSGVFTPFFLNLINLTPGQSFFIGPNIPHAYIIGDILEVMACSDNVIRCGLTPKYKDIITLCSILNFHPFKPIITSGKTTITTKSNNTIIYSPPVEYNEFELKKVTIINNNNTENEIESIIPIKGWSIGVILQGCGNLYITQNTRNKQINRKDLCESEKKEFEINQGDAFLISPDSHISIKIKSKSNNNLEFYQCYSKK